MRLELTGRHLTVTLSLRRAVQAHLEHLERLLNHAALSAKVVVTREKSRFLIEMTLHARGEHFLHGEASGHDWPAALAAVVGKIERQGQKLKGKWGDRKRQGLRATKAAPPSRAERAASESGSDGRQAPGVALERAVRVVRTRGYTVRPMTIDEAALEMSDGRSAFLVFRNASSEAVSVIYRRPDGNLGLIEPEA